MGCVPLPRTSMYFLGQPAHVLDVSVHGGFCHLTDRSVLTLLRESNGSSLELHMVNIGGTLLRYATEPSAVTVSMVHLTVVCVTANSTGGASTLLLQQHPHSQPLADSAGGVCQFACIAVIIGLSSSANGCLEPEQRTVGTP
jgi:hypothetical protein